MAVQFFASLLRSEFRRGASFLTGHIPHISPLKLAMLQTSCNEDEVKQVIYGMGPFKAPGPDGFHAAFF